MAVIAPPAFLQNLTNHTAETDRSVPNALGLGPLASNSLKSLGGVNYTLGGALKVVQSASPAMSVDVPSGVCQVPGTEGAKQGVYTVMNDATVTLTVTASHPSLPRIDVVTATITDQQYSGATNTVALVVTAGTPASSPAPATPPNNSLVIAQVRVNAGVTSIVNANITDTRQPLTAIGGCLVCTTATKPTLGLFDGFLIFCTDTEQMQVWDGAAWQIISHSAAWLSYTPSLSGITLGNGSIVGQYEIVGKRCTARWVLTFGSTTSVSGGVSVGLPATGLDAGWAGTAFLFDNSLATNRQNGGLNGGTTITQVFSSAGQVSTSVPFAWAVSDVMKGTVVFELA